MKMYDVPQLKVQSENPLHLVLQSLCEREPDRYDISRPFFLGKYIYATDGRAIGRITKQPSDLVDGVAKRIPRIDADFWNNLWQPQSQWRVMPRIRLQHGSETACYACRERNLPECTLCDGLGCQACDETGVERDKSCPVCFGDYFGDWPYLQAFGDKWLDIFYVRKLLCLPGLEWNHGRDQVLFRSKGIAIVVKEIAHNPAEAKT